ncbi:glycoprotein [Rhodococcus maanshanensis]|uniref:glycoprotein n=1 Tax=Rhodococcus maanshanensis TaxID=183556 RepID=UPI0022B4A6F5|nr:glycoprotein [Rhodococcus maanshanensis]MCZ4555901.1 glycoprotein [Rhodococcus maanshanensis]
MRATLRRFAVTTLSALALAAAPMGAAVAAAAPTHGPDSGAESAATEPASSGVRSNTDEREFVGLTIDKVTPTAVTTSSEPLVTVTGSVSNVGDRPVHDVKVRLQAAPAVSESEQLRSMLTADQEAYDTVGEFTTVTEKLQVGQSSRFTLAMPLRSASSVSLGITEPGVYPLLVNVNGTPEYGGQARLDDARFLLPVLGLPRDPSIRGADRPDAAAVPPSITDPVAITLMWPFADKPRLASGIPGSSDEKVRLVDDDLADSLADGGRLEQLLAAAEFATGDSVDRDHKLANSMCLAVDPDLLITVSNMTRGYLVVDDPSDPNGPAHEGTGQTPATEWLERLRSLSSRLCTTAVPFAQVDLAALQKTDDPTLVERALSAPAGIVDGILGITSRRGLTWPDSGVLNPEAAGLRGLGPTALLADNAVAEETTRSTVPLAGTTADRPLSAALFDVPAATALAAVGATPQTPTYTPADVRYDLSDDSRTARLQDALGAIAWPALTPPPNATPNADHGLLVVPPQNWSVNGDEARTVLSTVSTLMRSGLANPRPLADLLDRPTAQSPVDLDYPAQAAKDGAPERVQTGAAAVAPEINALTETLVNDPQSALTPRGYTAPLSEDLLRALSTSGRRDRDRGAATAAAETRVSDVEKALTEIYASVTVLPPGGAYTLASEQSPLLLVARNDLPVGINVRLQISAPPEMTVTDIGDQQLPPRGSRTLQVPATVENVGKLVVDVALTTTNGRELGEPTSVSIRTNAYGKALAIITACAGALLLLLAGRRLWHRFRGQPDPADEGYEAR